ncbi:hypothetical protein HMPREF0663_10329 [Hoylesella oralis ATCC 33269]|uniref:Uncharacterized protein n=1 Tax=Hoylesella oralis ATCC 33269 TaxID=873533 RepID=E7RMH9_9BACT|nr:hypothetical protein HMPREF0663_10329 [Hoylesella oralis ATCC 33269]
MAYKFVKEEFIEKSSVCKLLQTYIYLFLRLFGRKGLEKG